MRHAIVLVWLLSIIGAIDAPCSADEWASGEHTSALPGRLGGWNYTVAPGEPPSVAHPKGTIILARPLEGKGVTLTEWDIALEGVVREVPLGWAADGVAIVRTGDTLHLVTVNERARHAVVSAKTFQVQRRDDLGAGEAGQVASDGSLTVVSWHKLQLPSDRPDAPLRWSAATMDANGHVLGRISRVFDCGSCMPWGQLAVLNGHVYALVGDYNVGIHLLELSSSLAIEREVATTADLSASIGTSGGRLVVEKKDGLDVLSPGLDLLGHYPIKRSQMRAGFTVDEAGRIVTRDGLVFLDPTQPAATSFDVTHFDSEPMPPVLVGAVAVLPYRGSQDADNAFIDWYDLNDPLRHAPMRQGVVGTAPPIPVVHK